MTAPATGGDTGRVPRVLVAPVTVTPTKPLTPSHVKGLLWVDALYKATALVADVDLRYSLTTYNVTGQTLGFWEYLDRAGPRVDFATLGEDEIGEWYVRYQAQPQRPDHRALLPYRRRVEQTGWVHPASARLVDLWVGHYRALGLHDPGLGVAQPPASTLAETVDTLASRSLCLDLRADGGPVYLDATRFGLPLRQIVSPDGQPNYLACALRELVPVAAGYDEVVLLYDRELAEDYLLLDRVLTALGARVSREVVDRVPIDGVVRSSRHGGWQGYTLSAVRDALADGDADDAAVRLGLRLYFIAVLGRGTQQSFRVEQLRAAVTRAGRLLATAPRARLGEVDRFLRRAMGGHHYVDPYRLTSALLARHGRPPVRELTRLVLV
ncbi:hypothetical protein [Micromonospora cathayae]|uniref:Uncharacterized protein n=1 Tax=Micromonospora cathayae TaxID=3028804 RepID=A0ABY7ZJJ4_9ACTN|nr:hypothetical protein [Micromonospora sp. HUAS 3]WDZ83121.1 hypothetical protein PVK37_21990 [Micromonospora sp. HUAS 3]